TQTGLFFLFFGGAALVMGTSASKSAPNVASGTQMHFAPSRRKTKGIICGVFGPINRPPLRGFELPPAGFFLMVCCMVCLSCLLVALTNCSHAYAFAPAVALCAAALGLSAFFAEAGVVESTPLSLSSPTITRF